MRCAAIVLFLAGCSSGVRVDADAPPPELLSDFRLLEWVNDEVVYSEGVVPYDLNTPLFSDRAQKDLAYIDLPVGSALIKNFIFPADFREPDKKRTLVETRILLRGTKGWVAYPYLWNADQTDAELALGGAVQSIDFLDETGTEVAFDYLVPQKNQCVDCHELKTDNGREIVPIGTKARNLNRDNTYGGKAVNQLTHLEDLGWLKGLPPLAEVGAATDASAITDLDALTAEEITKGARDYLDINCAHCHNPAGSEGVASQLFLNWDNEVPFNYGVCKSPGSAGNGSGGLTYDIVPGDPERSILHYRLQTEEIGSMMPDIGRAIAHDEGTELVARWIEGLTSLGVTCSAE